MQVQQRSAECQKLIELLQIINTGAIPYNVLKDVPTENYTEFDLNDLTGLLDVDDMIMMGHSFGAATALLTMGQNKQLRFVHLQLAYRFQQEIVLVFWINFLALLT